ncbi:hypothetical protein F8M41_005639 [Gigaspora margarita]|uniref:Uncharacterized protein n=1 Tax=Gigaspora margarita TaxID=4874 RepID=A0A8H4A4S8_GIGMA|nr:hypothetical protein F8M41_005639 [Gigaspora margarita]
METKDGRPIADILNTKIADAVKLILKKDKNDQTQFMKSVIRLGLSSIIDYLPSLKMECLPDNKGKCQELSEIAITMTVPVMNIMFNNVLDYLKLHWKRHCLMLCVLDNFLKEDLTNEDVQDSKILGIQFSAK